MKEIKTSSVSPDGSELSSEMFASRKAILQLASLIAIGLTMWVWFGILSAQTAESAVYMLNVGQGDSQLIVLAPKGGAPPVKILIDGGPNKSVLDELDKVLGKQNDKYLDIVVLTHTDLDHLGGLVEVAKRYDIGLFVSNGKTSQSDAFKALQTELAARNVPSQVLLEGDGVRYEDSYLAVLSPDSTTLKSSVVNETGIVTMLHSEGKKVLFTADIGFPTENILLRKKYDLTANILKVGHHGSKFSSSENFIAAVRPLVSVIGVGRNSYGHPTSRVLTTLEIAGSHVYQTNEDGIVKIPLSGTALVQDESEPSSGFIATVTTILTGEYKQSGITTVSLSRLEEEEREFNLTPHKECSFKSGGSVRRSPIVINEVAWMGSLSGATHEWIELRNISESDVNVSGWQLLNANERIHITFPQKSVFDEGFMILARSAANKALKLDADLIFTGAIRNSKEGLRLYDNECNLMDEIPVASKWVAGNNKTKQTMERKNDLSWTSSATAGGTPGL